MIINYSKLSLSEILNHDKFRRFGEIVILVLIY
jgi:hypothetical protein